MNKANEFEQNITTNEIEILPPELSTLEAKLSTLLPRASLAAEETKRRGHLFIQRKTHRKQEEYNLELAETIVRVGEQKIVTSLRRYMRQTRALSFLGGLLTGLLIGTVVSLLAMEYLAEIVDTRQKTQTEVMDRVYRDALRSITVTSPQVMDSYPSESQYPFYRNRSLFSNNPSSNDTKETEQ